MTHSTRLPILCCLALIFSGGLPGLTTAGRILIIPPMLSPSHRLPLVPLADALAARGHRVLFWAPVAGGETLPEAYLPREAGAVHFAVPIHDASAYPELRSKRLPEAESELVWHKNPGTAESFEWSYRKALPFCESLLKHQMAAFTQLLDTAWDVVIYDELLNPCGQAVVGLLAAKSPVLSIAYSATKPTDGGAFFGALPTPWSHVPAFGSAFSDRMDFWRRFENGFAYARSLALSRLSLLLQTRRLRQHLPELTSLGAVRNGSLLQLTFYPKQLNFARPLLASVVHFGLAEKSHEDTRSNGSLQLSQDILNLIDRSPDGFILISFGHLAKWANAPDHIREAFHGAVARLPTTVGVLWQLQGNSKLPLLGENVKILDWLPQRQLLGKFPVWEHPKVKAFVSHCGGNSVSEAITAAVPVLALPLYSDQFDNAARLAQAGAAIFLQKNNLTADLLFSGLSELLNNGSYANQMKRLSTRFEFGADFLDGRLQSAVFWVEHSLRHQRKLPLFLRSKANLDFWRYYCLDVWLFLTTVVLFAAYCILKVIIHLWFVIVENSGKPRERGRQHRYANHDGNNANFSHNSNNSSPEFENNDFVSFNNDRQASLENQQNASRDGINRF